MADSRDPHDSGASLFDDELSYEARTTVGTDLFGAQDVPDYPAVAQLGPFEILGRLARGGMAEVYLARQRENDGSVRHMVVKRILTEMRDDPRMLQMFLEEGRIATRLFHPNVCHVYECGEAQGATFMALEWVHGVTIRDVIRRARNKNTAIAIPVAVHIAARVANALHYVHGARGIDGRPLSIIHQDVSPHNVMVSWVGDVKLLDFGIAKTSAEGHLGTDIPQGKYEYMSPEQVRGASLDARSDVFALGIVLWEMLTCASLFSRDGLPQTMTAVVEEPTPSMRSVRDDIAPELDAIVMRALAKNRDERYASAGELQMALEGWLASRGHHVAGLRVAASIGVLFEPAEKLPLPSGGGAMLTGTLPALTGYELGILPQDAEIFSFDHRPSSRPPPATPGPPIPPLVAPLGPATAPSSGVAGWLAKAKARPLLTAFAAVSCLGLMGMAAIASAAAIYFWVLR